MAAIAAGGPCPCLGRCDDADNFFGFASDGNCCHSRLRPVPVELAYQEDYCLGDGWPECPRYKEYLTSGGSKNPILVALNAISQIPTGWGFALVAVLVVSILTGVWFLALRPREVSEASTPTAAALLATSDIGTMTAQAATQALTRTPTPTTTPTTTPSPTPTPTASPSATQTPTWTPNPTATATPSTTPSLTPSPEPTVTPSPTTAVVQPTRRPTSTPTPLAGPELLSPEEGQVFSADDVIVLRWDSVGILPGDAYYVITVTYSRFGETWKDETPWTRDLSWALSDHDYLVDLSDDGLFQWSVQVMRQTGSDAD
ncbi:MAG: hypothetical protein GWN58_10845, partial [Anaerolineae bacterium]|nr:hypothetical protein [Anaerolineae bacterium]